MAQPHAYPEAELVKRDIVYFYELQSDYIALQSDIAWDLFNLPYWYFLATPQEGNDAFLPRGCLALILAGALSHAGNICHAFGDQLAVCAEAVRAVAYADDVTERIRSLANSALALALADDASRDFAQAQGFADLQWVHRATVGRYFASRAASCEAAYHS